MRQLDTNSGNLAQARDNRATNGWQNAFIAIHTRTYAMKMFAIAAAASLVAFGATPAAAAEPVSVEIAYGDLDIATPVGAERLADRIAASVREVCAVKESRLLKAAAAADTCRDEMLASAVAQLDNKGAVLASRSLSAKG
jgi:UrcA family protein